MKPMNSSGEEDPLIPLIRQANTLPSAPAPLLRAAEDIFPMPSSATLTDVVHAAFRVLHAVLRFDSAAQPAQALGMRSATSDTRHLLFSVEGRDIDLRVQSIGNRFAMCGQILGPDETGSVELSRDLGDGANRDPGGARHAPDCVAEIDALGEFRIEDIPPGVYRVMLKLGGDQILLPPIEAGAGSL